MGGQLYFKIKQTHKLIGKWLPEVVGGGELDEGCQNVQT